MILSKEELVRLYRKRAKSYDITANLYCLAGFREQAYRRKAVDALRLHRGRTVVEIGCGTGLNFSLLQQKIGSHGRIIGIDLTDKMLDEARKRVQQEGWSNVELVQTDALHYRFPEGVDGILSSFAITLIPEYEDVIRKGAKALSPGGRFVILDLKKPDGWPMWITRLGAWTASPFGVSIEMADRHPWEAMDRCLVNTSLTGLYGGFAYISVGEAPSRYD